MLNIDEIREELDQHLGWKDNRKPEESDSRKDDKQSEDG